MPEISLELVLLLQIIVAVLGAYLVAFCLSLVIWTYRDIRARSKDFVTHFLAVLLVLLFNLPGLLLYFILRPRETLDESYERSLHEEAILQDLDEPQACPNCKSRVEPDFLLCPSCLTRLKRACHNCNRPLHLHWRACPYCGVPTESEVGKAV